MTSGLNKNWKRASTRQCTITYPYSVDRAEAIGITDRGQVIRLRHDEQDSVVVAVGMWLHSWGVAMSPKLIKCTPSILYSGSNCWLVVSVL
jgi:hypothetical protein